MGFAPLGPVFDWGMRSANERDPVYSFSVVTLGLPRISSAWYRNLGGERLSVHASSYSATVALELNAKGLTVEYKDLLKCDPSYAELLICQ